MLSKLGIEISRDTTLIVLPARTTADELAALLDKYRCLWHSWEFEDPFGNVHIIPWKPWIMSVNADGRN